MCYSSAAVLEEVDLSCKMYLGLEMHQPSRTNCQQLQVDKSLRNLDTVVDVVDNATNLENDPVTLFLHNMTTISR